MPVIEGDAIRTLAERGVGKKTIARRDANMAEAAVRDLKPVADYIFRRGAMNWQDAFAQGHCGKQDADCWTASSPTRKGGG